MEYSKFRSHCVCLPIISIDSAFKVEETYYPQVFLEIINTFSKIKKWADVLIKTYEFLLMILTKKYIKAKYQYF